MILDELGVPIVLAPLAGGPSTPALAAAVSEAGALGFVAGGYLAASALQDQLAATRRLTSRAIGVNIFVPGSPANPASYQPFVDRLEEEAGRVGVELGRPRHDDDGWEAKLSLLLQDPVPVVSFTFGCPPPLVLSRLQAAGSEVWITVTDPDEAREAARVGADALVVQGSEAGGHRASFRDHEDLALYGLLSLLQLVEGAVDLPLIAAGGIGSGRATAAVLSAGARAAQLGTAFMRCPEAGTADVHRAALGSNAGTALTRAFTGRLARGIRNRFMEAHGEQAPVAYPELHHVTSPLRAAGRANGDLDLVNLWAGEAHQLAEALPAGELVEVLAQDARSALAAAARRLGTSMNS